MVAQNAGGGEAAGGGGQWRRSVVVHTMCVPFIHTCCCSTQYLQCTLFLKGTDPLKIDQIFHFFFFLRKVYTFSSSFIWYDNHYRGAKRSTSGRGTKVARSLRKEAQFRSDWCVFYFILFILYIFFSPFTTLQYLIFSTINCPKTSQVAPDDTPTFEWRASVCERQCLLFQVFS